MSAICGWCGKPATGLASIADVRLCHGDDDAEPTCYEKEQQHMSETGNFLLRMHPRMAGDQ